MALHRTQFSNEAAVEQIIDEEDNFKMNVFFNLKYNDEIYKQHFEL